MIFATNQSLLPDDDQDGETDIYLRQGGQLELISKAGQSGIEDVAATFRAATPTLSHIVLETEEK